MVYQMLDLFSGLGGASRAFKERGWNVISVDIESRFNPIIISNILDFTWSYQKFDFIWASPPCDEFCKYLMRGVVSSYNIIPSMVLINKTIEIIKTLNPVFWVIENTKGSIPFITPLLGKYKKHLPGHFLWGDFPDFNCLYYKNKSCISGYNRKEIRALIPYELSFSLCNSIENIFKEFEI